MSGVAACAGFAVGKSVARVPPATTMLPDASTAIEGIQF